jgi:hypothetical protein
LTVSSNIDVSGIPGPAKNALLCEVVRMLSGPVQC